MDQTTHTYSNAWQGNALARLVKSLSAGIAVMFFYAASAAAQVATVTTVTSSQNPSGVGDIVTFTAKVTPTANYLVVYPAMFGTSTGQRRYYRYDLGGGGVFGVAVGSVDLTNLTNPTSFVNPVVVAGGGIGQSFVIYELTAGAMGVSPTDQLQLFVQAAQPAPNQMQTISIGVFETASSAQSNIGALDRRGPTALTTFTIPNVPTGTLQFFINGTLLSGCTAAPSSSGTATCAVQFLAGGNFAVTAFYSGDPGNLPSSGTLSGGQLVVLPISPTSLPAGNIGTSYLSTAFTSTGCTAPCTFGVTSGSLPPGLSLSPNGVLSGVPTLVGTFMFTVGVIDGVGATGSRSYSVVINRGAQIIAFSPPASGVIGRTITLSATSTSNLPVSFSASPPAICTLNGSVVTFVAGGSCFVVASQNGDTNFQPATPVSATITVASRTIVRSILLRNTNAQSLSMTLVGAAMQTTTLGDPGINFRVWGNADLDGNSVPDLVYQNLTQGEFGDVRIWRDGLSASDFLLRPLKLTWRLDAVGDLDGDGFGDLVWRFTGQSPNIDDSGVSYVWFTNGSNVTQVRKRGGAPLDWTLLGAMDINNDGAADMVYVSPGNQVRVLMATPARTCANLPANVLSPGFTPLRLADFTGQRRADVLARNVTTGATQLLSLSAIGLTLPPYTGDPNDQNASCTPTTLTAITALNNLAPTDPSWMFYGAADFNGDGVTDILWLRPNGQLTLWLMRVNNQPPFVLDNVGTAPAGYYVIQF
jgi:Bacterial Ig-like domain (group 3)